MSYFTTSNQVAALKELYKGDDFMKDLVYKTNPAFALISKDESPSGMGGKYMPVPLIYGPPAGGGSATFSSAQTYQTAASLASFFIYRVSEYQIVTITNELLEATEGNESAFIDEAKLAMDTGFRYFGNRLANQMFGYSTREIGKISSGAVTSGAITLTRSSDIVNFEVGQVLNSYSVSGDTPTVSTSAALGYVISVNRGAGTLVVSATAGGSAGTPTNWSGTNFPYLANVGDINFTTHGLAAGTAYTLTGFGQWLPSSAPSSGESFWGVDRSTDTRLSGQRFDGSSESIEEALIDGASLVAREGGMPDMCFMNYGSYAALEKSLGSKVQYVDVKHEEADIAFSGIRLHAPHGVIDVIPDRNCVSATAYLLQMNTWKIRSLNKAPHILTYGSEGLEGLRVGSADALEVRLGFYGNLTCNAPGWNCVVSLST